MDICNIQILSEIEDPKNDSIDICFDSESGDSFILTFYTPKNILERMEWDKTNFLDPSYLPIMVRELTPEIITETLEEYCKDDAFWLKLYQFGSEIDISVLDQLNMKHQKEKEKGEIESKVLNGLDDLEEEINKLDNLNNVQKSNLTARIEKLLRLLLDS